MRGTQALGGSVPKSQMLAETLGDISAQARLHVFASPCLRLSGVATDLLVEDQMIELQG